MLIMANEDHSARLMLPKWNDEQDVRMALTIWNMLFYGKDFMRKSVTHGVVALLSFVLCTS